MADETPKVDGNLENQEPITNQEPPVAVETPKGIVISDEDLANLELEPSFGEGKEAIIKQTKAYQDAKREMHRAQSRLAEQEKELAKIRESVKTGQPNSQVTDLTDAQKAKLEEDYGMPFKQIKALYDIQSSISNPTAQKVEKLSQILFNNQVESIKSGLRTSNPYYKLYEADVNAKLANLPIEEQLDIKKINDALKEVIVEKLPEILTMTQEEAVKKLTGSPQKPPIIESSGGNKPQSESLFVLSKEAREHIKRTGGNPDEVEKYVNEKGKSIKSGWDKVIA